MTELLRPIVRFMATTNNESFHEFLKNRYTLTPQGASTRGKYFKVLYGDQPYVTELDRANKWVIAEIATWEDYKMLLLYPQQMKANAAPK